MGGETVSDCHLLLILEENTNAQTNLSATTPHLSAHGSPGGRKRRHTPDYGEDLLHDHEDHGSNATGIKRLKPHFVENVDSERSSRFTASKPAGIPPYLPENAATYACLCSNCDAVFERSDLRDLHFQEQHTSSDELRFGNCPPCITTNNSPYQLTPAPSPHQQQEYLPSLHSTFGSATIPTKMSKTSEDHSSDSLPPSLRTLPTVRDHHTTNRLTYDQDEYIPREYDEQGERKVSPTGEPLGGRQFKIRTFHVAHRGEKRFMLATECARILRYRDAYLLFDKNRSLHKIITTQPEKDELIHQEILPYSYRSRQIAIITAKSIFRQFGARVIEGGRRVRDDYWESKAIKQGFTEEDIASNKRPGATKARDVAAVAETAQAPLLPSQQNIICAQNALETHNQPYQLGGLPLMKVRDDSRVQTYSNIVRPRQEIAAGTPYLDRTQSSSAVDVMHQASNATELKKQHSQQRAARGKIFEEPRNEEPNIPSYDKDTISSKAESFHGVPWVPPGLVSKTSRAALSIEYSKSAELSEDAMELIRSQVLNELSLSSSTREKTSLKMAWNLPGFMENQFLASDDDPVLGSVIVLIGSALYAQATTCLEYVQRTWPAHGSRLVTMLQEAINNEKHQAEGEPSPQGIDTS